MPEILKLSVELVEIEKAQSLGPAEAAQFNDESTSHDRKGAAMLAALPLVLIASLTVAGVGPPPVPIIRGGADPARGLLVNRTVGLRPFDPLDPTRHTLVLVPGFNPTPRLVHFEMAQRLADSLARRGSACNVAEWDWNAATFDHWNPRANARDAVAQGQRLAAALVQAGIDPARTHLIGHSAGGMVATSAARDTARVWGRPVAQLTLLEPATYYHRLIFQELQAGTLAPIVENYYTNSPSAFGGEVHQPGVRDYHVDGRAGLVGVVRPIRSDHLAVFHWYLATVENPASTLR